jgi:hypothetical protein
MQTRRSIRYTFILVLAVFTAGLGEVGFRVYDYLTNPNDNSDVDTWIREVSRQLEEHPSLGYRRIPNQVLDERTQVDRFGMANAREAVPQESADVVGIGDSYMEGAQRTFFGRFEAEGLKYHSLALFGYGLANYEVLMKEFAPSLHPRLYVYATYLANDPGDAQRYETWRASGKSWFDHNGGYVFPIERRGLVWGWRLFFARGKRFARNQMGRINPGSWASLRSLVKRDDADLTFEYVLRAKELADQQGVKLLVVIIPRDKNFKPILDPVAKKLVGLCTEKAIDCLDVDPAFGEGEGRERFFAPDKHWNEEGMSVAWTYMWNQKLQSMLAAPDANRSLTSPDRLGQSPAGDTLNASH